MFWSAGGSKPTYQPSPTSGLSSWSSWPKKKRLPNRWIGRPPPVPSHQGPGQWEACRWHTLIGPPVWPSTSPTTCLHRKQRIKTRYQFLRLRCSLFFGSRVRMALLRDRGSFQTPLDSAQTVVRACHRKIDTGDSARAASRKAGGVC